MSSRFFHQDGIPVEVIFAVSILDGFWGKFLHISPKLVPGRYGPLEYVLQTPKNRAVGGRYFLDPDLLAATGGEFVSLGKQMQCVIDDKRLETVLRAIDEKKWTLAAFEDQAQVRDHLGIVLPKLVKVETDTGLYGIAEAYGTPGLGIKEAIHGLKGMFIGKDPLSQQF